MRLSPRLPLAALCAAALFNTAPATEDTAADEKMLRAIYTAALTTSPAYEQLRELTTKYPGRLSGSKNLEGAVLWGEAVLKATGADRTELQPVLVPHWERGAPESVMLGDRPLAAAALGNSGATPAGGLTAPVIELSSLDALQSAEVKGKIVFFNRPMNPRPVSTGLAYGEAGDQRNRGPAAAAKRGRRRARALPHPRPR
jgi:carboxypeptidase Q